MPGNCRHFAGPGSFPFSPTCSFVQREFKVFAIKKLKLPAALINQDMIYEGMMEHIVQQFFRTAVTT